MCSPWQKSDEYISNMYWVNKIQAAVGSSCQDDKLLGMLDHGPWVDIFGSFTDEQHCIHLKELPAFIPIRKHSLKLEDTRSVDVFQYEI